MRIFPRPGSTFLWYDFTLGGNRYRGSTGETNERKAQIAAAEKLAAARHAPAKRSAWAITQILGTWYEEHASHTKSGDDIWSHVQNLERCLDVRTSIDKLTNAMIMDFRARRRGEGVKPPTINRDIAYFQAACRWCSEIHGQPEPTIKWSKLKYPESPARKRFASADEFERLMAVAHPELADIIFASIASGLRRENVLAQQWHWLDLRGKMITVPDSKNGDALHVDISPQLLALYQRRWKAAATMLKADDNATTAKLPTGPVFDASNWKRRWHAARKAAGLIDFRWHDLRHTFGTYARRSGVDLVALQHAMHHKDIKTTMRYAHIEADEVATTFDKVGGRMAQFTAHPKRTSQK